MTQINFYSGTADKLLTACQLCAKAVRQGLRVIVYVPDISLMAQFDQRLWSFSPTSFIPHCRNDEEISLVQQTPVILSNKTPNNAAFDVLLNLHHQSPPYFEQFTKIIEIAGTTQEDKSAARERYRNYKNAGFDIHHYQLDAKTD
ncbi:MAG: DNA polymerase III subunit chi [Nitrosomonas sp.]|nr:MAG: DNA polymerase III subunit chi [Nitrosomonas sp.]